jgi:hypothetical protein
MLKKNCFVICLFFIATIVFSQDFNFGNYQVALTSDGTGVVITRYNGSEKEVRIPSTIQGLLVKEIGNSSFYGNNTATSIIIPEGVTIIRKKAFGNNYWTGDYSSRIQSITLPSTLVIIEEGAFYCCSKLTSIVIPENVIEIGKLAFESCYSLYSVSLPSTLQKIEDEAFKDCEKLTYITIPDTVININVGRNLFYRRSNKNISLNLPSQAAMRRIGYKDNFN